MLNQEQELRFCKARRASIARDFGTLNPEQQKAVLATEGPLLLLAVCGLVAFVCLSVELCADDYFYGTRKFNGNVLKKAYGKNLKVSPGSQHAVTDYFLEDGDYFKLDQLTLGYTLRTPKLRFLDGIKVFGTVNNVFTLTKFSGIDPTKYSVNGLAPGANGSRSYYPSTRQYILGFQVDF